MMRIATNTIPSFVYSYSFVYWHLPSYELAFSVHAGLFVGRSVPSHAPCAVFLSASYRGHCRFEHTLLSGDGKRAPFFFVHLGAAVAPAGPRPRAFQGMGELPALCLSRLPENGAS